MDSKAKLDFVTKKLAGMEQPPTQIDGSGCVAWILPSSESYTPSTTYLMPNTIFGKDGFPTLQEFKRLTPLTTRSEIFS